MACSPAAESVWDGAGVGALTMLGGCWAIVLILGRRVVMGVAFGRAVGSF